MSEPSFKKSIALFVLLLIVISATLILGIRMQIPDQQYCNTIFEHRHDAPGGSVFYIESQHRYDFSLNQSKCIYNDKGEFVANPEYSIWGIRI